MDGSNALAKLTKFLNHKLELLQQLVQRVSNGFRGLTLAIQVSYLHQSYRLPCIKDQMAAALASCSMNNCVPNQNEQLRRARPSRGG